MVSAPFIMNFMLLVPLASKPAVEICSETSLAGINRCARLTLYSGRKKTLSLSPTSRIDVDHGRDVVDQLDDQLGQRIGRRGLAGEEEGARRHVERRVVAQAIVEDDDVQHIEQLPLVFVDAFDLAVEDGVGIDGLPGGAWSQTAKRALAARLAWRKPSRNAGSSARGTSLLELGQVGDPVVADGAR